MGSSHPQKKHPLSLIRKESPIGIISITILGIHLNLGAKQSEPNLRIRISNQYFTASNPPIISVPQGYQGEVGEGVVFNYVINSFYKAEGRSVQIGYFSKDTLQYHGALDANVILQHKAPQEIRCILTDKYTERGYVLIRASFQPRPFIDFNFRFETATIRRKTATFGEDYVGVRLTIGQEILQTEFQKDMVQRPPIWEDKIYNFKVPQGVLTGLVQLISMKEVVLGRNQIDLLQLSNIKQNLEVLQSLELFNFDKQKQIVVADLKYSFILGNAITFAPRAEMLTSSITGVRTKYEGEFEQERHQAH